MSNILHPMVMQNMSRNAEHSIVSPVTSKGSKSADLAHRWGSSIVFRGHFPVLKDLQQEMTHFFPGERFVFDGTFPKLRRIVRHAFGVDR